MRQGLSPPFSHLSQHATDDVVLGVLTERDNPHRPTNADQSALVRDQFSIFFLSISIYVMCVYQQ